MAGKRSILYLKFQIFSTAVCIKLWLKVRAHYTQNEFITGHHSISTDFEKLSTVLVELPPLNAFHMFQKGCGTKALIEKYEKYEKEDSIQVCNSEHYEN